MTFFSPEDFADMQSWMDAVGRFLPEEERLAYMRAKGWNSSPAGIPNAPSTPNIIVDSNHTVIDSIVFAAPAVPAPIPPAPPPPKVVPVHDLKPFIPDINPRKFSKESASAPYDTIFFDFGLEAIPFYNFWTEDETQNDREDRGNRKLEDIPRFVRVVWNRSPILPKTVTGLEAKKDSRKSQPVAPSPELKAPVSTHMKGQHFYPDHLQPKNFSMVVNSCANGFVHPGVVNAVMERRSSAPVKKAGHVDEDAFLADQKNRGIPIHEAISHVKQRTSGPVNAARVGSSVGDPVWKNSSLKREIASDSPMRMQFGGVKSPTIGAEGRPAKSNSESQPDHLQKFAEGIAPRVDQTPQKLFVRGRFMDQRLGGVISKERVANINQPHQAECAIAVAHMLPHLEVLASCGLHEKTRKVDIPSFKSPPTLNSLEYAGYLLEKYVLNPQGSFELMETIELSDPDYTEYIDTKVLYGKTYRYRIRAYLRWSRPLEVGVNGPDLSAAVMHGSQTRDLASLRSSYFSSEWSPEWAYAYIIDADPPAWPDELTVRPDSSKKIITVTARLPDNPQRDIYIIRLFRKLKDAAGKDLTGWVQVGPDYAAQNIIFVDSDVDFYEKNGLTYVYSAMSISRHGEYSFLSEQLGARLNGDFLSFGEHRVMFVSSAGVRDDYFGAFSVYPFKRYLSEVVARPIASRKPFNIPVSITFQGRDTVGSKKMDDRDCIVRIESLDTGESFDVPFSVTYDNQPIIVNSLESFSSVTSAPKEKTIRRKVPVSGIHHTRGS